MPQQTLKEFRLAPATQVVSLGNRCSTAHNIHRYFNAQAIFPFDWWISPAWAVAGVLRSRFDLDFLYDPALLELTPDRQSVWHKTLGIFFVHEFPRIETEPARPVVPNYVEYVATPRSRTAYLAQKLFALNRPGERILFVRGEDQDASLQPILDELFPQAEWTLAEVAGIPPCNDDDWRGDPAEWDAQLGALGVTLDRTGHAPFRDTMADAPGIDAPDGAAWMRERLDELRLGAPAFSHLLINLGDDRPFPTILRNVQQMLAGHANVSGEMRAMLNVMVEMRRSNAERLVFIEGQLTLIRDGRLRTFSDFGGSKQEPPENLIAIYDGQRAAIRQTQGMLEVWQSGHPADAILTG